MKNELPNMEFPIFDQSYRSATATFIGLLRKIHFFRPDKNYKELASALFENSKAVVLRNPLNSGEALKAFTYPWDAYFVIKVPQIFTTDQKFKHLTRFTPARMFFDFTEPDNNWQICGENECKDSGTSLDT